MIQTWKPWPGAGINVPFIGPGRGPKNAHYLSKGCIYDMKVLLTGMLPRSVWTIAERIARGGHQVTVIGAGTEPDRRIADVHPVKLNQNEKQTTQYIAAMGFEAIIFFFACQCEDRREYGSVQGAQLDVMFEILHGVSGSTRQFVLVTDQRVFGQAQFVREDENPIPDTPTGVMLKAAESCVSCGVPEEIRTLIVRTTSVYAQEDPESFFAGAMTCARTGRELMLNGSPDSPCDFLHAEDLGVFLDYAVSMSLEGAVHVFQGGGHTWGELVAGMKTWLPELSVSYLNTQSRTSMQGDAAAHVGWVPRHDCLREMEDLCQAPADTGEKTRRRLPRTGLGSRILKWTEVVLLGLLAAWLTVRGENNALLATVDYILLYVILIGFIHGRGAGTVAALLSCAWYCYSFIQKGGDASDLIFNTDHWLPMSIYLLCGIMFGYAQDRQRLKTDLLQQEREEVEQERDFMEGIYQSTYEDRDRLKEQIYHYRDSYGRIYQITRELDTLESVQVFLSTLSVLESTMQTNNVAIYECQPGSNYVRLVVRSREIKQLQKSMNMAEYQSMYETLKAGKLFANRSLMSGYPTYALPVMSGDEMLAILMLWNLPFEQQSMYTENLLSVVAGLVQSALIRAIQYHQQLGDLYYEDTHILTPEAFRSALGIYQTIRQRRTGDYILVRLRADREMSMELIDRYIGKLVRSTDLVGRLDDGEYYVLFPQATTDRLPTINARFQSYGINCDVISEDLTVA